jgi:hypothetical protein
MVTGAALAVFGSLALAWLGTEAPWRTALLMSILGVGLGLTMPPGLVAAQMAVPHRLLGVITATTALFRTLGGAVGIAVLTSILFAQLGAVNAVPDGGAGTSARVSSESTAAVPATGTTRTATTASRPILDALSGAPAEVLREAFLLVFGTSAAVALMALLLALTLPARRLSAPSATDPVS